MSYKNKINQKNRTILWVDFSIAMTEKSAFQKRKYRDQRIEHSSRYKKLDCGNTDSFS